MNIGLIAHDAKKKLMQNFCIAYRGILSKHELYATGTTGNLGLEKDVTWLEELSARIENETGRLSAVYNALIPDLKEVIQG